MKVGNQIPVISVAQREGKQVLEMLGIISFKDIKDIKNKLHEKAKEHGEEIARRRFGLSLVDCTGENKIYDTLIDSSERCGGVFIPLSLFS